jgi:putative ABC transport system ATP-binding protein
MPLRVEARQLEKTYRAGRLDVPVLRGVDLAVEPGEFVAVMGPSGCGKSTLLYLIGGLTRPTAGQVLIDGRNLTALADRDVVRVRRETTGFVFQRFNLLPALTALGNLRLALTIRGGRNGVGSRPNSPACRQAGPAPDGAADLLRRVGLDGRATFRPRSLSAGEQQRVAIARAVVHRPALLLADEPTGNLDGANAEMVLDLLTELNRETGQTILMVTHNREVAARAHRTIYMRDGRIVPDAEHALPAGRQAAPSPPPACRQAGRAPGPASAPREKTGAAPRESSSDGLSLRRWFYPYAGGLAALLAAQNLGLLPFSWSLLTVYFFYMAVACTFCPVPTAWFVMSMATQWNPLLVTVIGTVGTGLANLTDYHILTFLLRRRRMAVVRTTRWYRKAEGWFRRAPFWTLAAASFLPIPVDAVRLLAIGARYPRLRFALASLVGRAPRYAVLAYLADQLNMGTQAILAVMAATVILGISRGLPRLIRQVRAARDPQYGVRDAK